MASRPPRRGLRRPCRDIGACAGERVAVTAEMMGQCAATLLVLDQHDLDAVARQHVDGGLVDAWRQHLLRAALQQRNAGPTLAGGCKHAAAGGAGLRQPGGRHRQHGRDAPQEPRRRRGFWRRQKRARKARPSCASRRLAAEPFRARQHQREQRSQQPLRQRAAVIALDPDPRLVDQMHVVHARRTGGHAGEAGEAAVDMLDHRLGRLLVLLQHLLDQVDAAARAIELVAEQHIGRTGGGAEAAMHAGAQDLVGFLDVGVGELREAEFGLHAAPRLIRPRLRICFGSKLCRTRSPSAAMPGACGWNTSTFRRTSSEARSSMA